MSRLLWILGLVVASALIGAGSASGTTEYTEIDVVVNITSGPGGPVATTQEILDAIEHANKVLKQADVKLVVKKVNSNPTSAPVAAGNADGNSSYTTAEGDAAHAAGGTELDNVVGAGKGIKITVTSVPWEGTATPGWSIHNQRTAVVQKRATTQQTGETIAHECGHILTLGPGHVVTSGPAGTKYADGGGHPAQSQNFMAGSNVRTGTQMTTQQAEEIRRKAKELGRTVTQAAASTPTASQPHGSGGQQDRRKDHCRCLCVCQVGDGGPALSNAAHPVMLRTYSLNTFVAGPSIPLPILPAGSGNRALTMSGTATSEGYLSRSDDGRYVVLAGYNAAVGTPNVSGTNSAGVNRVVGLVDADGNVDTTTAIDAYNTGNIRSAVTVDGEAFWTGGTGSPASTGGVRYVPGGSSMSTQLSALVTNTRVVGISEMLTGSPQLFVSTMSGAFRGVNTVGQGLPTTGGQPVQLLPGFDPNPASPQSVYDYVFTNAHTLYVADDRSVANGGGLQKWMNVGGVWTLQYTLNNGLNVNGLRGLTVLYDQQGEATFFATTAEGPPNRLVHVRDFGPGSPFLNVAMAQPNTVFRGVAIGPMEAPAEPVPSGAGLYSMEAYRLHGTGAVKLAFATEQVIDRNASTQWEYAWYFDTDNDRETGVSRYGARGVEVGVRIEMMTGGGEINSQAWLEDYVKFTSVPLGPATFVDEPRFDDTDMPPNWVTNVQVVVDDSWVPGLRGSGPTNPIPMVLSSHSPSPVGRETDRIESTFVDDYEEGQADLTVSPSVASAGDTVGYFATDLTASSTATLYLDDAVYADSLAVEPNGHLGGTIVVPAGQPATKSYYFVTVIDAGGRSAFAILHVIPCLRGDVDNNGTINQNDAPAMAAALLSPSLDEDTACRVDVDGNGRTDGEDIQALVGLLIP